MMLHDDKSCEIRAVLKLVKVSIKESKSALPTEQQSDNGYISSSPKFEPSGKKGKQARNRWRMSSFRSSYLLAISRHSRLISLKTMPAEVEPGKIQEGNEQRKMLRGEMALNRLKICLYYPAVPVCVGMWVIGTKEFVHKKTQKFVERLHL